jgi:DNA-binding NarL/FixJ family response regulator
MEADTKYKKKEVGDHHGNTVSIFLVDDDASYLYPLGFYLQKNTPHMVYCYTSGEECMKNIYHNPDIIILDFNLAPEAPNVMNGLEVLKEVKSASPKTKVIMLSGRDTVKGVIDSMKLGAYTYIVKDVEALASLKKIIDTIANEKTKDD